MATLAIVKGLHVLEDDPAGRLPGRKAGAVNQLGLERAEEALHRRVVPAVALAAHRLHDPVPGQDRPVVLARVLETPRSEWWVSPRGRCRRRGAIRRASHAGSARRWSAML